MPIVLSSADLNFRARAFATALVPVFLCFAGCGSPNNNSGTSQQAAVAQRAEAQTERDNLQLAHRAFVGEPPVGEIKRQMDRNFALYGGLPATNEIYGRAGSALVALRKQTGVPEMRILDHMARSHVPGVKLTFPDAAGLSASFLQAGDK